jgi:hypothetical protein
MATWRLLSPMSWQPSLGNAESAPQMALKGLRRLWAVWGMGRDLVTCRVGGSQHKHVPGWHEWGSRQH